MCDTGNIPNSRFWAMWTLVEPYYEILKTVLITAIIVFNICCISLCISAFLFGTIYFYQMPTIQHTFPLHFHYNRTCMQQHQIVEKGLRWNRHLSTAYTKECFPVAKIDIASPTNTMLLQEGQAYSVVFKLELPETPGNLNMGMFMVNVEVEGCSINPLNIGAYRWSKRRTTPEEQELTIVKSTSKPMIMRYKSRLLRLANTVMFWPLLLFDFMHESQVLDELLFEDIMLDQKSYNWTASIYLENPGIEVYSANLDVVAKFSGIQYLLYRWPIVSFVFGTLAFFLPTVFVCAILFYFAIWKTFFAAVEVDIHRNMHRQRPDANFIQPLPSIRDVPNIEGTNDPAPTPEPELQPELQPALEPELQPAPEPELQPAPEPELQPAPEPELQPAPIVTETREPVLSEHDAGISFTALSTSEIAYVYSPPTPRRFSRRSSSSSSIEMIGQPSEPSNFSHHEDEEIFTSSSLSLEDTAATNEDATPADEMLDHELEEMESSIRKRFPQ